MAKGSKRGKGGKKNNQRSNKNKGQCKPQSMDARKKNIINEIQDVVAPSWTSDEENEVESHASFDVAASNVDRANFEAARSQVEIRKHLLKLFVKLFSPSSSSSCSSIGESISSPYATTSQ